MVGRLRRRAVPAFTVDPRHIPLQSDHKNDHILKAAFLRALTLQTAYLLILLCKVEFG